MMKLGKRAGAGRSGFTRSIAVLALVVLVSGSSLVGPLPALAASSLETGPIGTAAVPVSAANQDANSPTTTLPGPLYVPVLSKDKCNRDNDPSIFGVQMYGNTGKTSRYQSSLVGSHARWVRVAVNWDQVEPSNTTPNNYNWTQPDLAFSGADDSCVTIIATHDMQPSWAATYTKGPVDRVPLSELQQYFRALVERYDGDGIDDAPGSPVVNYWEMYNEPDAYCECSPGGWGKYPGKYAAMLKAVYPVIKDANPNAQVLFGGVLMDNYTEWGGEFYRTFFDDVLDAGGGDYFDIMNLHTYVGPFSRHYPALGIGEKAAEVRASMSEYRLDKPIIITETGWHSNDTVYDKCRPNETYAACDPDTLDYVNTEEHQARYVPQIYARGIQANYTAIIWWMLWDTGGDYQYDNGLVTGDNPPVAKPAYTAYIVAERMLGDTIFIREHPASETGSANANVLEFHDSLKQRTVIVAWIAPVIADEVDTVDLYLPQATVYDPYGNAVANVSDADDGTVDGRITIANVGAQPKYIVSNY